MNLQETKYVRQFVRKYSTSTKTIAHKQFVKNLLQLKKLA